jgi:V/A-type H+-transporting ATPase subunit I
MAISKMKKMTLLAEKDYLEAVMLSLQSYQAVEVIPADTAIQNELVNAYYDQQELDSVDEDTDRHEEQFEMESNKKEISRVTSQLDDVEENIEFLEEVLPKPGFFASLNQEKETYSLDELHDYMENININKLINDAQSLRRQVNDLNDQKEKLEEERSFLNRWRTLDFNPKTLKDFKITRATVGAIDTERYEDLEDDLKHYSEIYFETLHYSEEEMVLLLISSAQEAHDVEQTLIRHRFERLNYVYDHLPEDELIRNRDEIKQIDDQLKSLKDRQDEYSQLLKDLKLSEEHLFNVRERLKVKEEILISEHLFVLSGWIEEDVVEKQIKNLEKVIGEGNVYTFIEDVSEKEAENVPIKYDNNKATSAFENVVSMYSTPKYNEMDPTPFVQPFSILFFGMMTADAGYGLLGIIAVFTALKFLNLSTSMKKNLEFFGQLMIGTTLAGLFFGSFFGFELPFGVMSLSDQLLEIMILSMGIGLVHLILGLFLNTILNNRKKNYAESFTDGYSWILILLSAVAIALNAFFGGPSIINMVAIAIILLSLAATVLINIISNENKIEGVVNGVFSLFDVTSYIGDVISYTRLTALGVASANIGMAFNLVIGLLPVWARFTVGILIFIGLHLFNMFIAMISGYVHTLRLNYVEFFGKFYSGGGREFAPIPLLQKHILIRNNSTE